MPDADERATSIPTDHSGRGSSPSTAPTRRERRSETSSTAMPASASRPTARAHGERNEMPIALVAAAGRACACAGGGRGGALAASTRGRAGPRQEPKRELEIELCVVVPRVELDRAPEVRHRPADRRRRVRPEARFLERERAAQVQQRRLAMPERAATAAPAPADGRRPRGRRAGRSARPARRGSASLNACKASR